MRPVWDEALTFVWEKLADGGVSNQRFYTSNRSMLRHLGPERAWKAIFDCKVNVEKCGKEIVLVADSCLVGKSMFDAQLLKCSRVSYIGKIGKGLSDLEHLDFDERSVSAFKSSMRSQGNDLVAAGVKFMQNVRSEIEFLGAKCSVVVECLHDEWEWRLGAMMKTQAVNTNQVEALPWEELCYDAQAVPGARETGAVPEAHLEKIGSAREAARDYLQDISKSGTPTLAEMQKVIKSKRSKLTELDRGFEVDLCFLDHHAGRIITERVHADILAALPTSTKAVTSKED